MKSQKTWYGWKTQSMAQITSRTDMSTHEFFAAELSLSTVTDEEVLPNLLKQAHRKIRRYQAIELMRQRIAAQ